VAGAAAAAAAAGEETGKAEEAERSGVGDKGGAEGIGGLLDRVSGPLVWVLTRELSSRTDTIRREYFHSRFCHRQRVGFTRT